MSESSEQSQKSSAMEKLQRTHRIRLRVLTKQTEQVNALSADSNRNRDTMIDETNELEHNLAQSSVADQELLDAISDDTEYEETFNRILDAQKAARKAIQVARRVIEVPAPFVSPVAIVPTEPTRIKARLPQINLPSFSGDYTAWHSFIDQFRSSVDANEELSSVQKLMYLKGCLTSHASKLIMNLETTESNYEVAIQMLEQRYKNDRVILRKLLSKIHSFVPVKTECVSQLRHLHGVFNETSQSLRAAGRSVENDFWHFLLFEKLDPETQKAWEISNDGTNALSFDKLLVFLDNRVRSLEVVQGSQSKPNKPEREQNAFLTEKNRSKNKEYTFPKCKVPSCQETHLIWQCEKYKSLEPKERREVVATNRMCFNCLSPNHAIHQCTSTSRCKECQKKHHTSLHGASAPQIPKLTAAVDVLHSHDADKITILPTANVKVRSQNGRIHYLRALIDNCAQTNIITLETKRRLGIKSAEAPDRISGVNQKEAMQTYGRVNLTILPKFGNNFKVSFAVLENITEQEHPNNRISVKDLQKIRSYSLADPNFDKPNKIDMLLGQAVYAHIVQSRNIKHGTIILTETMLGWTLSGIAEIDQQAQSRPIQTPRYGVNFLDSQSTTFDKFWEIEDIPSTPEAKYSCDELECIRHFDQTTTYGSDGRAVVRLPINKLQGTYDEVSKEWLPDIGHSARKAFKQFISNEKRLRQNREAKNQYNDFFQEMIDTGHIEKVPVSEQFLPVGKYFIMPHAVWKSDSTTTKCRAVFNGSAPTSNGKSLNDCLLVGPKQQPDLFNILVRFRFYKIALSGDITKMYRQLELHPTDRNLHQLYWRREEDQPIEKFRMTRAIYGIASSSYHAIRVLSDVAEKTEDELTKQAIRESFYVDDLLGGADTPEDAIKLRKSISGTLGKACLQIRKWASNSKAVMDDIPENLHENKELFLAENDHSVKTLGLHWHPVTDCFQFKCIDKLDSVKPLDMPQGNADSTEGSRVEFGAISGIQEKEQKVVTFSSLNGKQRTISGISDPLQSNTYTCPMNHQDFCQGSKYLGVQNQRSPNPQLVTPKLLEKAENKNHEQQNRYSHDQYDCPNAKQGELGSKNETSNFEDQKVVKNNTSFLGEGSEHTLQTGYKCTSLACPIQENYTACPYNSSKQKSSQFKNSYQVVNFDENFLNEKSHFGPSENSLNAVQGCPNNFAKEKDRRVPPSTKEIRNTNEQVPPTVNGQLKLAKKKRNIHKRTHNADATDHTCAPEQLPVTRRIIASNLGRVFDQFGRVTPVTILPKVLFQKTWDGDLEWDDDVGASITSQFRQWVDSLSLLSSLAVPRYVAIGPVRQVELHLFCDASEMAYGAAIYVRTKTSKEINTSLLAAKSRLAPRKTVCIPRLELCSMVLGCKLLRCILKSIKTLKLEVEVNAWSDSTIALAWIRSTPSRYSTFVANRIAKVQHMLPADKWKHVPTHQNPADHTTRPVAATELQNLKIWWSGPSWLQTDPLVCPTQPTILEADQERKRLTDETILLTEAASGEKNKPVAKEIKTRRRIDKKSGKLFEFERWSSFGKALRIGALVAKFILKLQKKDIADRNNLRKLGLKFLVRDVQEHHFEEEMNSLKNSQDISRTSSLLQLYPFLDDDGLMKVGGRLVAADCLNEEAKFQMILPPNIHFSRIVIRHSHIAQLHCGLNATVAHTRQQFWIIRVKTMARSMIGNCITCFRFHSRAINQLMGDYPRERVNPSPPFSYVGIDLAGPMHYKADNDQKLKCYIVVFICFSTKAIHLDICKALDTEECLKTIRRFIARRGCPKQIFSDNGTNFIGSLNELIQVKKLLQDKHNTDSLPEHVRDLGINWTTIPARAPSFGGLWEAAVKSMKLLYRKTIGNQANLKLDEMYTVLCQIEAILNSRPITTISDDAKDTVPLTPSMLLNGFKTSQLPIVADPTIKELSENEKCPRKRFQYLHKLIAEFWKKWTIEYLTAMQQRNKNRVEKQNLKKGDLVYITDDDNPPLSWPLGIVEKAHAGNDNLVRVVQVKTGNGKLSTRPILRLRKLPIKDQEG